MIRTAHDRRWVQFDPYRVDLRARELTKHGSRLKLQSRPFEILSMLLERPGDVVTRDEIRAQLWPDGTFVDFESNISSAVRKLREALCDSAAEPRYIETVGRVGYRFIARVEGANEGPDPPLNNSVASQDPPANVTQTRAMSDVDVVQSSRDPQPARNGSSPTITTQEWSGNQHRVVSTRFVLLSIVCISIAVLVANLSRKWLGGATTKASIPQTQSMKDASAEYTIGRELWARRGEDPLKAAIEHFNRAIQLQPDYGLAYSGLADSYVLLPFYSRVTPAEAYPAAKAAALKAISLAPQSAVAHTSLAYVKLYGDWDFPGAEAEFQTALQRDPTYPTALQWHAEYLSLTGRSEEAISEIKKAITLMPNSPVMHHNAGQIYQTARRYDEAIEQYSIALRLDPTFATSNAFMAAAYGRKGMYDKAIELQLEYAEQMGDATRIAVARRLADTYRSKGIEGHRREIVATFVAENPDRNSYPVAEVYAMLGEKDLAFQYLERAYQLRSPSLLSLNVDPELDSLRSDPRFLALRRRIGLPAHSLEFF